METVLGLSMTSASVGWVLLDGPGPDATTLDYDAFDVQAGIQAGNNYLITLDDVIGSRGGIPLMDGGQMIGSIGCSGGTGSQDEVVCRAGANAVNK